MDDMRTVDGVFSFALRFHPDVADLSQADFRRHCYVQLLRREPEAAVEELGLQSSHERAEYVGNMTLSEEFGGYPLPLREDVLVRLSRAAGWPAQNSAFYYACRYISLTVPSYADFVSRLVEALGRNTVARSAIQQVIGEHSDIALIRSLMDGMIDLSAEFTMATAEMSEMKKRLAELEKRLGPADNSAAGH